MTPPEGIDVDLFSGGQICDYEFRDLLELLDHEFLGHEGR